MLLDFTELAKLDIYRYVYLLSFTFPFVFSTPITE